jgi:hypothetical protein
MRTNEGEKLLAFVLREGQIGRFRARHIRLPETDGMRAEERKSFYLDLAVA